MSPRPGLLASAGACLVAAAVAFGAPGVTFSDFTATTASPASTFTAASDTTIPVVSAAVAVKAAGGTISAIRANGTYYVYATATDETAMGAVTANLSTLGGGTAVAMTAGSYAIGGVTYTYRTALVTAPSTVTAGSKSITINALDAAGNAGSRTATVTVDNTAPSPSSIATTNRSGGTAGRPELGDKLTLTYTESMEPTSFIAGWTGASTNIQVALVDGGGGANDYLQFYEASASLSDLNTIPLGTIDLGSNAYITNGSYLVFGYTGNGTPSTMVRAAGVFTITLGTPTAQANTVGTATMKWTPSAEATDLSGNPSTTATLTESGSADVDF